MIGCSEFCGHYCYTFEWIRARAGEEALREYWTEAVARDSQQHAADLIIPQGIEGMVQYWGHTLAEEEAGYVSAYDAGGESGKPYYRIDMFACPSLGYNLAHGYSYYHDYCSHCMGWLQDIMDRAGFVIHHDHDHRGRCWWEMRPVDNDPGPSEPGELTGRDDLRLLADYAEGTHHRWQAGRPL